MLGLPSTREISDHLTHQPDPEDQRLDAMTKLISSELVRSLTLSTKNKKKKKDSVVQTGLNCWTVLGHQGVHIKKDYTKDERPILPMAQSIKK